MTKEPKIGSIVKFSYDDLSGKGIVVLPPEKGFVYVAVIEATPSSDAVGSSARGGWLFEDHLNDSQTERIQANLKSFPKKYQNLKRGWGVPLGSYTLLKDVFGDTHAVKKNETFNAYVNRITKNCTDGTRKKWLDTYSRCILDDEVKASIEEAIFCVLNADKFEKWGINKTFEKGLTNSILLYGPPGTGKTMVAESIAALLDKNLMVLDVGALQSNMPGQCERNIKDSFKQAEQTNAVILLDECETLLYDRNSVGAIMSGEINALLTEIERFNGVVILTTNRLHKLDAALSRRIILKVELKRPTEPARKQIWEKLIPKEMPTEPLNFDAMAKFDLSGGEIKNVILLAARKAIATNSDIVKKVHFQIAIKSVMEAEAAFSDAHPRFYADSLGGENGTNNANK